MRGRQSLFISFLLSGSEPACAPPEVRAAPALAQLNRLAQASCRQFAFDPARPSAPTQKLHHVGGKFHWLRQQVVCVRTIRLAYIPTADQAADYLTKACPGVLVRRFQSALDGSCRDNAGSAVASTATSPPGAVGIGLNGRSPFTSGSSPTNQPIMAHPSTHLHL